MKLPEKLSTMLWPPLGKLEKQPEVLRAVLHIVLHLHDYSDHCNLRCNLFERKKSQNQQSSHCSPLSRASRPSVSGLLWLGRFHHSGALSGDGDDACADEDEKDANDDEKTL